jgi:hypothetical protein
MRLLIRAAAAGTVGLILIAGVEAQKPPDFERTAMRRVAAATARLCVHRSLGENFGDSGRP